jgi:hypothetical protein
VILTGEAPQLAGLENDLARSIPASASFPSTRPMRLRRFRLNLRSNPAAAETLSKSLAGHCESRRRKPSIAEAIIEEIGLHL